MLPSPIGFAISIILTRAGPRIRFRSGRSCGQSPVVHTKRFLGCYLPTTYEAVKEIAYDTEHFSSRRIIVRDVRPETTGTAPPITSDPPEHKPAKQAAAPVHARRDEKAGAAGTCDLQRADRRIHHGDKS